MAAQIFKWHEINQAPKSCGIYSWYFSPKIGLANISDSENARTALKNIATMLQFPQVDLSLDGHLSLELNGRLEHKHLGLRESFPPSLNSVVDIPEGRELIAEVLENIAPQFSSPLYIGISTNLFERLRQHRKCIEKNFDYDFTLIKIDGDAAFARDHSFGNEISRRKIDPNTLTVCTMSFIPKPNLDVRMAIEGIETLLNRMFYPIMGRR